MSMRQAIQDFPKQFEFKPIIERVEEFHGRPALLVSGIGGSHLAADLLASVSPMRIHVHSDYGLPHMDDDDIKENLFVASSYSGNTEEVLDGLEEARKKRMQMAAISMGGQLQELARTYEIPFIQLPDTGIQPRSALGFSLLALLKLAGLEHELEELSTLAHALSAEQLDPQGKELAERLQNNIPVIYASQRNKAIAANWKIKCNETAKIPACYNVFPELNHNEMTGFDVIEKTRDLSHKFHFIFLRDTEDDFRIQRRMDVCKELYAERGFEVTEAPLQGAVRWERIFNSLLVADWFSFYTGTMYGVETEQVPMVEEFKKLVSRKL